MKTILVTGASSGIGRALAVRAARAGYGVYAVGRNPAALAALAAQVGEEGGTLATDACDVSDPANAPALIGRAIGTFGRIDVLVNNAGVAGVGPVATQTDEQLRVQFGTHVIGPLALVREAFAALRASRGHVFMIGSGVARVPIGGMGAYPASKAALRSATATLRRELAPFEVAVTYVDPGAVDTAFMSRAGMRGAPPEVLVSPEMVARKILLAIGTRPRVLNAAPLSAAVVALAELFPRLTELVLERTPTLLGTAPDAVRANDLRGPSSWLGTGAGGTTLPSSEPLALAAAAHLDLDESEAVLEDEELFGDEAGTPPAEEAWQPVDEDALFPEPGPVSEEPEVILEVPELVAEEPEPPEVPELIPEVPEPVPEEPAPLPEVPEPVAEEPEPAEAAAEAELLAVDDTEVVPATSQFDAALEPLRRRMDRAHFDPSFVRGLLVPDAVIDVSEVAMRWAGMPNKHERALTSEVFFALAEWGFLAPRADGRYRVVRVAD